MTLRQLRLFLAVVEAGSFRRAAERAALSQPALSQQIRALEQELGAPLLDRLGRSVALTEAGRLLAEHARRVLTAVQAAQDALADHRGLARGTLVLGASSTPGLYLLPRVLGRFRARYPGITVTLRIGNTREIEERVRTLEVDLGIVGGHLGRTGETCVETRVEDRLVLVVGPCHPWARRRMVKPDALRDQCLLVREEGSATRAVVDRALERAGIHPRLTWELGHTEAIKQAVAAGLGVAFLSRFAVETPAARGDLRVVAVRGLDIRRHFHVIRHDARALMPAARALLACLPGEAHGA